MSLAIAVSLAAALGAVCRYLLDQVVQHQHDQTFPWGTFVINVSGSFLIGVLMTLLTARFEPHPAWRLFLVVGVLGGYTTFSSFEYETLQAVRDGESWMAMLYAMGSVMLGYLGVWLGAALAARR